MMKHAPLSSTKRGRAAALTIQDRRQVCPSDADLTNAKGVLGKGAVSNFGVRAASPGAIGTPIHSSWLDRGAPGSGHHLIAMAILRFVA
jgi:hypothetical protein